jgi:hypothetical protein
MAIAEAQLRHRPQHLGRLRALEIRGPGSTKRSAVGMWPLESTLFSSATSVPHVNRVITDPIFIMEEVFTLSLLCCPKRAWD